jgi:enamine deaminase RidA (YjgF/YER057c/UK114 family)
MPIEFLQPPGWPRPSGYAYGVAATGRIVCVSGMIGSASDFVGQVREALQRIVAVLKEAGAKPENIVRMTWYVVDREEYIEGQKSLAEAYKAVMGRHYPAMSVVQVAGLVEPTARVEIEVTAVLD